MKRMAKDSWLCQRPIAHRGLHSATCPENSLAAMDRAVRAGYPIEIDIHLLKSGELVVFHDTDFTRMAGKNVKIKDIEPSDLKRLSLQKSKEKVPLLDEVLALVAGRVPLVIEIKSSKNVKRIGRALSAALEDYRGDYVVQSYDPLFLRWLKRHSPAVMRGQILGKPDGHDLNPLRRMISGRVACWFLGRPDFLVLDIARLSQKRVSRFMRQGWILLGYTIKNQSDYEKLRPLYDNLVFEGFEP